MENAFFRLGRDYERYNSGRPSSIPPSGAAIGAAAALLMAPASGAHTRRRLRRKREEVADYLIDAGKELVDKCEDLYERSGEVVEDATHELSGKYRALHQYSRKLLDEAEMILRQKAPPSAGNREGALTKKVQTGFSR